MLIDVKCEKCNCIKELYFRSHKELENTPDFKCPECNASMKRVFSVYNVIPPVIAGYERENQDHLSLGQAVDTSKDGIWV